MKRLLLCAILLCGPPAMAQSNRFTLSIFQPEYSSESAVADGERVPVGMTSRTGFAIEASHVLGRASFALQAARFSAPVSATFTTQPLAMGSLRMTPISATVAFHVGNARVDPYIGAGAAWVMTGNLRSENLAAAGVDSVSVDDDFTYVVNGGINIPVSPSLALNFDARYMPVNVTATTPDSSRAQVKFNTLTIGAGLQWKF